MGRTVHLKALADATEYVGFRPDLDLAAGFDDRGFAKDGSGWRTFRYKPFPGAFWPTNGNTDDVFIRLPEGFRHKDGALHVETYAANLAILEASFASDPAVPLEKVWWPTEPLDESAIGADLDGNGRLEQAVTELVGLPEKYLGGAAAVLVRRAVYPEGTEFFHSVRYVDPDAPNLVSRRMKELRYSKKTKEIAQAAIIAAYQQEADGKDEGKLPDYPGHPLAGMRNPHGWLLQAFIEDADGRLRAQTHEEHLACMGCHTSVGVTLDQTFAFPRKVPGAAGWKYQSLDGIPDVPQLGHRDPEILTYFRRVGGGDEFRSNDEILEKFFPGGKLDEKEVRRAAPGGDTDVVHLLAPSRERAIALDKAYMVLVREQRFERGRDVFLRPPGNVHRKIENGSTGLAEKKRTYTDGRLRLDWSKADPARLAGR